MTLTLPRARVYGTGSASGPVQAVHADGPIWRTADNQPWRWAFCTAFYAAKRFLTGEDLSGFAHWTQDVGGNGWRVFGQWSQTGGPPPILPTDLSPAAWQDFAHKVTEDFGLALEVTLLTDCQIFGQSHAAQVTRVQTVAEALRGLPSVFLEICNEPWKNGADVDRIARDLGYTNPANRPVLMATGSYDFWDAPSIPPPAVILDYFNGHSDRGPQWPSDCVKYGHNFRDVYGVTVPIHDDEPVGADTNANGVSRDNQPNNFEDAGAGLSMQSAGGTFHSSTLCAALVPPAPETACAQAFFRGLSSFPADTFAQGRYVHDGNADFPLVAVGGGQASEAAGRIIGNRAAIVVTQPGINGQPWTPLPKAGWRITQQLNARGNILWMEKGERL